MHDPLPLLIFAFTATRLFTAHRDAPSGIIRLLVQALLSAAPLLFCEPAWLSGLVAGSLAVLHIVQWIFERRQRHADSIRLASGFAGWILLGIAACPWGGWLALTAPAAAFLDSVTSTLPGRLAGMNLFIFTAGVLAATFEANLAVRVVLSRLGISPEARGTAREPLLPPVDVREYNAGRWIGVLERTLIFYFVLLRQFEAIGLILAAKAFTRFKELDQRPFAEYILIGTLLSALLALVAAEAVRLWIAGW